VADVEKQKHGCSSLPITANTMPSVFTLRDIIVVIYYQYVMIARRAMFHEKNIRFCAKTCMYAQKMHSEEIIDDISIAKDFF
jgi:hypothetical protein